MPSHSYYAAAVMLDLLRDAPITIRLDRLGSRVLGEVDFATRVIAINFAVTPGQFRSTLTHELIHLRRGPCYEGREDQEEEVVAMETAALLVPPELIPADANPRGIAELFGVDDDLARIAIRIAQARRGEVA